MGAPGAAVQPPQVRPRLPTVELLRRYSNRDDLLKPLVSVMERVHEETPATPHEAPPLASDYRPGPPRRQVSERLTAEDIKTLVSAYLAGSTIRELAERYGLGTTSVKRLLRQHGARKLPPRRAA